uniref:Terpene synthase N-terminal domain-containing protein n=1 Tax=Oryza punctata TaxID=4537 RepID=A0A0E0K1E4_ORYPU
MVPLRGSSQTPCFPKCVDWILQNQQDDGSWSIDGSMASVNKDILSSTLACVLALNSWNVGRETIRKGLDFIAKIFSIAMDEQTVAPIGFGITFPPMLNRANGTGLEFPVRQTDIDRLTHLRDIKLESFVNLNTKYPEWLIQRGREPFSRKKGIYMAYLAEGFGNLLKWDAIMKLQRKNGSLFNCPSSTAAAASRRPRTRVARGATQGDGDSDRQIRAAPTGSSGVAAGGRDGDRDGDGDGEGRGELRWAAGADSGGDADGGGDDDGATAAGAETADLTTARPDLTPVVGSRAPALDPVGGGAPLSMVDALEKMGISHSWLGRDEEIMLDITTCVRRLEYVDFADMSERLLTLP